ncbi:MAG: ABC transporter ATP-binding protein [Candidatus Muproteobacteria bacterium RBG_16_65_34]|uniref:ABC transporter ATP-binding protein n=1 Tax=Candidatus Muproteobacteria bacterium RBG_16_65_34 TaxID=1817760 RepID=A0A1F6TTV9_9PROT|nr:MAG: ABC transporter ATP-binding protein [Candidatus Muproteobacteria bacterium RBG_16_65_34]
MSDAVLVEVSHVSRFYGALAAVRDVSFTIHRGEVLGFLGPNGAGKTTTMQIISGNLAPSSGSVTIAGHDLLADPRAAKAELGYLPESPPLYRELTVDEYLDYCAALNRIPRGQRAQARATAKEKCGLHDAGRRLIGNLSKGFQQRVGIAQAIIHMPAVVILDEPTVGLDPIQIREIRALIRELGKTHGVILSTHILPEVQAVCDHVQIIHKGALVLHERIEGLARRVKSATLAVAFRAAPDPALIERLPGVHKVESDGAGRLRVFHEPGQDPAEAIVRLAAEKCWGIYEIAPERASLEQLFVELTGGEPAAAEAAT